MIRLETYKGTKSRHTCPACNSKGVFVRYITGDSEYLSFDVGRCNRESKCGYHKKPKEYFAENPASLKFQSVTTGRRNRFQQVVTEKREIKIQNPIFDFIAPEHLKATLGNYDRNAFVQFLFDLFPDCSEEINNVLGMYFVGTFEDYTCFSSIDECNQVSKAKLIRFNRMTGKRLKGKYDISSLVRKLNLKEDFQYKQIFFGEHLLQRACEKSVAIVEAEKTAIVASLCLPQFIWLATGSKQWLKVEHLQRLGNRQIILCPDADGFNQWQIIASNVLRQGLRVKVSSWIENFATEEQKQNQYDLADYLIEQQRKINQSNELIDSYNPKLETILNDDSLYADFETILDEQKAVLIISGGLSEIEAENQLSCPDYYRKIVLSL